ncbi:MAG: hemerythrin domain-containing protein [Planctomycetes bacterium]|nr:hemerythrin domain-containing protein [Planctomycetota bacterium]
MLGKMTLYTLCVTLLILMPLTSLAAAAATATVAEADALYDRAMAAMEKMNDDSSKSVEAAVILYEAKGMYAELESWPRVREMNSYIFFCKKKMNIDELDAYIAQLGRGKAEEVRKTFENIEKETTQALTVEDAQLGFDEALAFADSNPDEHLKIHMRFLEISERAIETNSEIAIKASRRSSESLQAWVSNQKPAGPVSPFNKPKRQINLMGEEVGFPVPDKKELKKLVKTVNGKYRAQIASPTVGFFAKELLKIGKESLDQPQFAYTCVYRAAQLAADKKIGNIALVMECLDYLEEKFAVLDIAGLRKDIISGGRSTVGKAALKLFEDPNDAKSNAIVGLTYCVVGDNWDDGIPLLQRGDNDELKRIAAMESAKPQEANEQKQLADAWFELTGDKKLKMFKIKIIKRSAHWYGKSLAKLKGISKDQADKRLLMAASVLPVEGLEFYAPVKINDGTILTGKAWDDCRAHMATARADKGQVFTGVILLPGQKIRVLPNVGHRWTIGGHEGNYRGSGWYRTGDTFTLDGESKRVAIGTLLVQVGDGPFMRCTKTITGSGKVYVSPFRGSGSGTIDCKIVALPK